MRTVKDLPDEDYILIGGKKVVTKWQKCECGNQVFGIVNSDGLLCDDCENKRGTISNFVKQLKKAKIPDSIRWVVWERDNFTCQKCGSRKRLEVDHIHPESKGGTLDINNLQTLCKKCNCSKGAR